MTNWSYARVAFEAALLAATLLTFYFLADILEVLGWL